MSNHWLLSILLAAVVGSVATATGFVLGRSSAEPVAAPSDSAAVDCEPVVCEPVDCAPVACEAVDCEPVACVEPEPVEAAPAASRMRRTGRGTTQVLNPWDNEPVSNPF